MFGNADFNGVRVIELDGNAWFAAKDVAEILGYSDTQVMTRRLDDDEKGMQKLHTLGGEQELSIINESGLYNAIFGSQKPEAKAFRKWVTSKVLPSIRKTGGYASSEFEKKLEEVKSELERFKYATMRKYEDLTSPHWQIPDYDKNHRVKPTKKGNRPFMSVGECRRFLGRYANSKEIYKAAVFMSAQILEKEIGSRKIKELYVTIGNEFMSAQEAFESYVFDNGEVFGICEKW